MLVITAFFIWVVVKHRRHKHVDSKLPLATVYRAAHVDMTVSPVLHYYAE